MKKETVTLSNNGQVKILIEALEKIKGWCPVGSAFEKTITKALRGYAAAKSDAIDWVKLEFMKYSKDPDEDEKPYDRGVRIGKSVAYQNVLVKLFNEAGERKFTLDEALEIANEFYRRGLVGGAGNGNEYFKEKFGIDLGERK